MAMLNNQMVISMNPILVVKTSNSHTFQHPWRDLHNHRKSPQVPLVAGWVSNTKLSNLVMKLLQLDSRKLLGTVSKVGIINIFRNLVNSLEDMNT